MEAPSRFLDPSDDPARPDVSLHFPAFPCDWRYQPLGDSYRNPPIFRPIFAPAQTSGRPTVRNAHHANRANFSRAQIRFLAPRGPIYGGGDVSRASSPANEKPRTD